MKVGSSYIICIKGFAQREYLLKLVEVRADDLMVFEFLVAGERRWFDQFVKKGVRPTAYLSELDKMTEL